MSGAGKKVEVTVSGNIGDNSDGLRMWLAYGTTTASDQYYYTKEFGIGMQGQGDGDLKFTKGDFTLKKILTVTEDNANDTTDHANNFLIKAANWDKKLNDITITDIQIRYVGE